MTEEPRTPQPAFLARARVTEVKSPMLGPFYRERPNDRSMTSVYHPAP